LHLPVVRQLQCMLLYSQHHTHYMSSQHPCSCCCCCCFLRCLESAGQTGASLA
jgi:hypothetical protein